MSDEQQRDLAALWALDALDAKDRAAFEAASADGSAEAEETLAEAVQLRDTAAVLGAALPAEVPPERLRASVLAAIAATPQLAAGAEAAGAEAAAPDVTAAGAAPASADSKPQAHPRARWRASRFALAASVVVALTLGGLGTGVALLLGPGQTQEANALAALASADDRRVTVAQVSGGGSVTVTASAKLGRAAVSFDGVAAAPSDRVYELWFIGAGGTATPAGTVAAPRDGGRMLMVGRYAAGDAIGVTVEPKGGSPKPTTKPIAVVATS